MFITEFKLANLVRKRGPVALYPTILEPLWALKRKEKAFHYIDSHLCLSLFCSSCDNNRETVLLGNTTRGSNPDYVKNKKEYRPYSRFIRRVNFDPRPRKYQTTGRIAPEKLKMFQGMLEKDATTSLF